MKKGNNSCCSSKSIQNNNLIGFNDDNVTNLFQFVNNASRNTTITNTGNTGNDFVIPDEITVVIINVTDAINGNIVNVSDSINLSNILTIDVNGISSINNNNINLNPSTGNIVVINQGLQVNGETSNIATNNLLIKDNVPVFGYDDPTQLLSTDSEDRGFSFDWVDNISNVFSQRSGFFGWNRARDRFVFWRRAGTTTNNIYQKQIDDIFPIEADKVFTNFITSENLPLNGVSNSNLTIQAGPGISNLSDMVFFSETETHNADLLLEYTSINQVHTIGSSTNTTAGVFNIKYTGIANTNSYLNLSVSNMEISHETSINLLSKGRVNILADDDINITSNQESIFIESALKDVTTTANINMEHISVNGYIFLQSIDGATSLPSSFVNIASSLTGHIVIRSREIYLESINNTNLTSGNDIILSSGDDILLDANDNANITANTGIGIINTTTGDIAITNNSNIVLTSGEDIVLNANDNANINAITGVSITNNTSGNIAITNNSNNSDIVLTSGEDILLDANDNVNITANTGIGIINTTTGDIAITNNSNIVLTSQEDIVLNAGDNANITANTGVEITNNNSGDIVITNDSNNNDIVLTSGEDILLNANDNVNITANTGVDITNNTSGDIAITNTSNNSNVVISSNRTSSILAKRGIVISNTDTLVARGNIDIINDASFSIVGPTTADINITNNNSGNIVLTSNDSGFINITNTGINNNDDINISSARDILITKTGTTPNGDISLINNSNGGNIIATGNRDMLLSSARDILITKTGTTPNGDITLINNSTGGDIVATSVRDILLSGENQIIVDATQGIIVSNKTINSIAPSGKIEIINEGDNIGDDIEITSNKSTSIFTKTGIVINNRDLSVTTDATGDIDIINDAVVDIINTISADINIINNNSGNVIVNNNDFGNIVIENTTNAVNDTLNNNINIISKIINITTLTETFSFSDDSFNIGGNQILTIQQPTINNIAVPGSATTTTLANKVNEIISMLKIHGLIVT